MNNVHILIKLNIQNQNMLLNQPLKKGVATTSVISILNKYDYLERKILL